MASKTTQRYVVRQEDGEWYVMDPSAGGGWGEVLADGFETRTESLEWMRAREEQEDRR